MHAHMFLSTLTPQPESTWGRLRVSFGQAYCIRVGYLYIFIAFMMCYDVISVLCVLVYMFESPFLFFQSDPLTHACLTYTLYTHIHYTIYTPGECR